jgi:murein DD-endopeptidase MepM/ murein hydrolase activator NlpD
VVDNQTVAQVAAQLSIPPSLLFGLSQVRAIDSVAELQTQAQALAAAFAQAGSWEAALSQVVSGDPAAYQSPTSPAGGTVNAIMGIAAARPGWGVDSTWKPASGSLFNRAAGAFGRSIQALAPLGGVVTADHAKQWFQTAAQVRRTAAAPSGNFASTSGPGGGAAPFQFGALPFDRRYVGAVTEGFGERSGPGGYTEQGADYGLPHGTALTAPIAGTVRVVRPRNPHSGTGLTVYIRRPDGTMAYIGHMGETTLQDGQQVEAGEPIGTSGGVPGIDEFPGNSSGAHVEVGIIGADGRVYNPQPVLEQAMQSGGAGGGATSAPPGQAGEGGRRPMGAQPQPTTSPAEVAGFAQRLKAMNVTPEHFEQLYPHVAVTRRRLLGLNTSLDDLAPHVGQTPADVLATVRATPHPRYPEHTAGSLFDMMQTATLHAPYSLGRMPYLSEAARMLSAKYGHGDVEKWYRSQVESAQLTAKNVDPGGQQTGRDLDSRNQNDNVVDMPRRQGGPQ